MHFAKNFAEVSRTPIFSGSYQRCSVRKGVLRNFTKFTGKTGLRPATLLKKRHWHRCFPVNFVKFLGTTFLQNTSGRLLLILSFSYLKTVKTASNSCKNRNQLKGSWMKTMYNIALFTKLITSLLINFVDNRYSQIMTSHWVNICQP